MTRRKALAVLDRKWQGCEKCELAKSRSLMVPGEGDPEAPVMFIGEGPGQEEDKQGRPFVGPAGQLLDRMILAMGFLRQHVFIANMVKCRPPSNRPPEGAECDACRPYLEAQIQITRPLVIVLLGGVATRNLLGEKRGIMSVRGVWREFSGIPVMPTFHPAFLLRQPSGKRYAWSDLLAVVRKLVELGVRQPLPPAIISSEAVAQRRALMR